MKRLNIATRDISSWRERLANPDRQWQREYSAFEAAVSWELAGKTESGLPSPIQALLELVYGKASLLLAIAEHKVPLPGGNACSQNDVWGLVKTNVGSVSLTIEAKAGESFGNESLATWLLPGGAVQIPDNRAARWQFVSDHLPTVQQGAYGPVAYQLLHRCALAVIEARRFGLTHAACIVQAFNTPNHRFAEFNTFCQAIGIAVPRGSIQIATVGEIQLAIGWADCPLATDRDIAAVV